MYTWLIQLALYSRNYYLLKLPQWQQRIATFDGFTREGSTPVGVMCPSSKDWRRWEGTFWEQEGLHPLRGNTPTPLHVSCSAHLVPQWGMSWSVLLSVGTLEQCQGHLKGQPKDTLFLPIGASSWSNLIFLGLGGSHGSRLAPKDLFSTSHLSGIGQASLEVWHRRMFSASLFSCSLDQGYHCRSGPRHAWSHGVALHL